jgi:putative hydrolase of the HAD superfamily
MPVRAVLFDFDDTLVPIHTVERWQWAWKPQGPRLNERHLRASIREGLRRWDRRRWQGLLGDAPPADAQAYHAALRDMLFAIAGRSLPEPEAEAVVARFPKYPGPIEPYPDLRPCLEALRARGLRLEVLTGPLGARASTLLAQMRLGELVPSAASEGAEAPLPPAREAFHAACKRLAVNPHETAVVGDLFWSDVRAAGRAGLRGVLLDRNDWWSRVEAPRIRSLSELADHLDRMPESPPPAGPPSAPVGGILPSAEAPSEAAVNKRPL